MDKNSEKRIPLSELSGSVPGGEILSGQAYLDCWDEYIAMVEEVFDCKVHGHTPGIGICDDHNTHFSGESLLAMKAFFDAKGITFAKKRRTKPIKFQTGEVWETADGSRVILTACHGGRMFFLSSHSGQFNSLICEGAKDDRVEAVILKGHYDLMGFRERDQYRVNYDGTAHRRRGLPYDQRAKIDGMRLVRKLSKKRFSLSGLDFDGYLLTSATESNFKRMLRTSISK